MEVHKFSKFIHGCAVLLPEEVTYFIKLKKNYLFFSIFVFSCLYLQRKIVPDDYYSLLPRTVLYKKIYERINHDKI